MGKSREYVRYGALLFIFIVASLGGVYLLKAAFGAEYPIMVVVSQSMVPTLGVGDFIIVGRVDDFASVAAAPGSGGEILVYVRSTGSEDYIVHRAIHKYLEGGDWWFVTKGDNNPVADGQPVPESRVVGRVLGRIPVLGYFPLFIKTLRGFLLVGVFMGIVFFADYLMPLKKGDGNDPVGRFPWASLAPYLVAPLAIVAFWFLPNLHPNVEVFALVSWYVGCLLGPLAFRDDDLCLMFWLYHFVLLMIPISCDLVWWATGITPSMWWVVQGSTVPVTWLLLKETTMYSAAYTALLSFLAPGCALFLLTMLAKRRKVQSLIEATRWMRSTGPTSEQTSNDSNNAATDPL